MTQGRDCRRAPPVAWSVKPFNRAVDKLTAEVAIAKRERVATLSLAKWTKRAIDAGRAGHLARCWITL